MQCNILTPVAFVWTVLLSCNLKQKNDKKKGVTVNLQFTEILDAVEESIKLE